MIARLQRPTFENDLQEALGIHKLNASLTDEIKIRQAFGQGRVEINDLILLFDFPSSLSPPRGASRTPSMVSKKGVNPL